MSRLNKKSLFLIVFAIASPIGCSNSKPDFESKIESLLKVDIPSKFEVVRELRVESVGGDSGLEFVLQFDKKEYEELLSAIDLEPWKVVDKEVYSREFSDGSVEIEQVFIRADQYQIKYLYYKD
jgi:hypothetical protein